MKSAALINLAAKKNRAITYYSRLEKIIQDNIGPCCINLIKPHQRIDQLTADLINDKFEKLIVIGGDGTINSSVNGYFQSTTKKRKNTEFLFIPLGTGSDFGRLINEKTGKIEDYFKKCSLKSVDVGKIIFSRKNEEKQVRYFLNTASLGISSKIADGINNSSKKIIGRASFFFETLKALLTWKDIKIRLVVDDFFENELNITALIVANGRFFGGGMKIAPLAMINDGFFDIIILKNMVFSDFILNGHRLYQGNILNLKGVSFFRGRSIKIKIIANEVAVETDGEILWADSLELSIIPEALKVLAPWKEASVFVNSKL